MKLVTIAGGAAGGRLPGRAPSRPVERAHHVSWLRDQSGGAKPVAGLYGAELVPSRASGREGNGPVPWLTAAGGSTTDPVGS